MPPDFYEIRTCNSCGLRYPITSGHPYGTRCPACMGDTRLNLTRKLNHEPGPRPTHRSSLEDNPTGAAPEAENRRRFSVLLDNIRSAWNVGSILRTADGFGFDHAYLCGISPTPENEAVTRASLGAEDAIPWSYHKDSVRLVKGLKKEGWRVHALEEDERAIPIHGASTSTRPGVLILGNEVTGVDPELLDLCDAIHYIPMRGEKRSFNVAIAFGIAAYALE